MRSVTALAVAPRGGALGVVVFAKAISLQCSDPSLTPLSYAASIERSVGTNHTPNGVINCSVCGVLLAYP